MIAEVYPLTKLPRRFTFFDYQIPEELDVKVGDIVRIKLRGRELLGVIKNPIFHTRVQNIGSLKDIQEIVFPEFLSRDDLLRFEMIASAVVQSPSTVLHAAFAQLKSRGLGSYEVKAQSLDLCVDSQTVEIIKQTLKSDADKIYTQLSSEGEYALASTVRRKFNNQVLIICPRERQAELLAQNLDLGSETALIHGKTLATRRESIIRAWQSGKIKTLIGTRQAALLAAKSLSAVIIFDCSSDDYRALNRNPRIDSRKAAELLAEQHSAKLFYTGVTPMFSLIGRTEQILQNQPPCELVYIKAQEQSTGHPMITEKLITSIENSLQNQKKVLLSFNRKGVARRLQCASCDHIPLCGTCQSVPTVRGNDLICMVCKSEMWIPEKCPSCQQTKLTHRGVGNKRIKTSLQKLFPKAKIGIVDKETQELEADILIVTEYYFKNVYKPFQAKSFGTVASLNIDLALAGVDFRSAEIAAYKLHRLVSIAKREHAKCLVQTWLPDLIKPLLDLESFIGTELKTRRTYHLPPIVDMATITCRDDNTIEIIKNPDLAKLIAQPNKCIIETDLKSYDPKNSSHQSQ